jgi:tRNA(fMet)-specific endonuclease VapC
VGVDRHGYLLDANVLSELLKPSPNQGVVERVRRHWNESTTAAPVYHEMLFGARRLSPGRRREMIEHYLDEVVRRTLQVLPYDTAAAAWHAGERARLSALGQVPPFVDGQIAAIAQTNGLTLITANVADFRLFTSLNVEDWTSPHGRADLP